MTSDQREQQKARKVEQERRRVELAEMEQKLALQTQPFGTPVTTK